MEPLHEHNQKTYENICRMYNEGIQRMAVVQPTGSGKSLLMAKLIEDNPDSRFFVLSTSHKINDQFKSKLDEKILDNLECNIYWNMPNMKQEVMESLQPDYIFLDEMHRALAKEWSKGINVLLNMYPDAKVLGLSATPIRYLDKCRNVAEELFGGNLACDMSLSQAILDGILPMARYVCGVYSYEKDTESLNKKIEKSCNSEEEKKELLKELKILKENLDKGHGVSDIFRKYIMSGNEKFVVFLKNTMHLRVMKPVIEKWFLDAGFNVRLYEVHSKNTDKDREFQAFREDKENGIKLCLSVNMLAEGIHGDIDGVIMLRETISANMYFQMIGRAFACGKKTIPLIIDLVANSQFISDAADNFPNEIRGEIEKRKKECEKEGKEYEVGFDVNEFIVMDEFMDVVSGFKEIEGRLQGSWDAMFQEYCKFYEENGHGDVPNTEEYKKLNNWCQHNRTSRIQNNLLEKRISLLDEKNFIWELRKYRFKNNIKAVAQYYKEYGEYPSPNSKDFEIRRLGQFVSDEKAKMREENYSEWKENIVNQYFPDFSCKSYNDVAFERFIYFFKRYKEKYGHTDIKVNDEIDSYKIGIIYFGLLQRKNKLSQEKIKILKTNGVRLEKKNEVIFKEKMNFAKEAAKSGVIISCNNRVYKKNNLYDWIKSTVKRKYKRNNLSIEEIEIVEKLIGKPLCKFFLCDNFIKIVDVRENKVIAVCNTQKEAAEKISKQINLLTSISVIRNRLGGKVTTPYKGRFMFYYATDEEIKKYLEESKAS